MRLASPAPPLSRSLDQVVKVRVLAPQARGNPRRTGVSSFPRVGSVARFANRLQTYDSRTSAAIRLAALLHVGQAVGVDVELCGVRSRVRGSQGSHPLRTTILQGPPLCAAASGGVPSEAAMREPSAGISSAISFEPASGGTFELPTACLADEQSQIQGFHCD
jgi:hypothetical protein